MTMRKMNIMDMRVVPGDSAYLIYTDETAVLYDSGFAFTGYRLAEKIKEALGARGLDYIFLTHSHYDHVLGSVYVTEYYPEAKVVAGIHTCDVFKRAGAIAKMKELDNAHAKHYGINEYEFKGNNLKVDIVVKEGDVIKAGDLEFEVLEFPGHTKCSIGFYERNAKLLLSSETLGIYHGKGILPISLVGYSLTMQSIEKLKRLEPERILIPHLGIIDKIETEHYLSIVANEFESAKELIIKGLKEGKDREQIIKEFSSAFVRGAIKDIYPEDAAHLNCEIMIGLIEHEFLS